MMFTLWLAKIFGTRHEWNDGRRVVIQYALFDTMYQDNKAMARVNAASSVS